MAQQFYKTDLVTTSDHEQQQQQQQQSNTTAAMDQTTTTLTTLYLWQNTKVLSIIICYCIIGSQLSVINKILVTDITLPNILLILQFTSCCLILFTASQLKFIKLENVTRETMIGFVPYSLSFFGLLSAGMFVMKEAPLETFIAFKSTTPIVISIVDYMFLGRKFPNTKSVFAMLGITVGAVWYVHGDILSGESAYLLCLLFIVFATAEGAIAKDTINRYQLNNWSRTFLMNLISIPIGIVLAMFTGEIGNFSRNEDIMGNQLVWTNRAIITLVCSCVFGVGMGVFTMLIRDALSAASVSVVATCNKFLAEIVNYFIWHNHASLEGAWAVCFIMACGAFYEQAPMRKGENGNFSRKTMLPCLPRSWVLGRSIAIEKPDDVELQQKNAY